MTEHPALRHYARAYPRVKRIAHHNYVADAVERAGGRVLWSSGGDVAPLFLAIEDQAGVRTGLWAYVFWGNRRPTQNRPHDEHRLQIRVGDEAAWRTESHPVGVDPAGLDVAVVLGVEPEHEVIVALDPLLYDPLPMGISVYWKDEDVAATQTSGFHVWERDNLTGSRRGEARSEFGVETVVAFEPERFFDYLRFEREAQSLRLDPPLRYRAAERVAGTAHAGGSASSATVHELENEYSLPAQAILEIISERGRLAMAVRGGVAEHHLGAALRAEAIVQEAALGHQEGPPDYWVTLTDGDAVTVECKNAAPKTYADGAAKVEVQKTRASRSDPASRYYEPSAFDVIAACMFGPLGEWTFRYRRSRLLARHPDHHERIAPLQRIDDRWACTLEGALAEEP